ncbi:MAG: hypothetical protein IKY91_09290, partial [Akkermansia sp.]|nr:hypothetical protein [Akkermansia sp.]
MKTSIRRIQEHLGVTADGIMGVQTLRAISRALGVQEVPIWPSQSRVRQGNSIFGAPGCEAFLVSLIPAYQLYFEGKPVRSIRVHKLIAPHVKAALEEVLAHSHVSQSFSGRIK